MDSHNNSAGSGPADLSVIPLCKFPAFAFLLSDL